MALTLSGPVGLRNRTHNVANKSADKRIVIDLLSQISDKCGGKHESWTTPPVPGPDGIIFNDLANAIWDFQSEWKKRGLLHSIDGVVDPGGKTFAHLVALTHSCCGPKVDDQFKTILTKIQTDFAGWSRSQKDEACTRILIPVVPAKPGTKPPTFEQIVSDPKKLLGLAGLTPDINGWDVLPLFQGKSAWLRSPRVLGKGCAVPSSPKPSASPFDEAHEDPCTCSDTVQIGGKCWLNGTVNYGTFGIMVKLCADEFVPSLFGGLLLRYAEMLIRGYKQFINKEDPTLPIEWVRATFNGGPGATPDPSVKENRPSCRCGCSLDGSIVNWDYVWEPVKPRTPAKAP
jgi:hypothetical protein